MRAALAAALLFVPLAVAAQTYKCKDAAGKLTYSNETCEKQGLKDAGEVRERLSNMPASELQARPAKKDSPKANREPAAPSPSGKRD